MEDTPLGRVVLIRKEDDKKRLENFTPYERRIRNKWREFRAKELLSGGRRAEDFTVNFEKMFAEMFGKK